MENIVAEAKTLAAEGYSELILVAQDLTRYGADLYGKRSLGRLLTELCRIEGIKWIRLHYLYPNELDDELIDVIAREPKIVKYLDIPIQHINDGILKKMNRRDTSDSIRALFKKLRDRIPGLVLRTSLITGLPGEGEAEFEELCMFLREAKIERAGVFPFSPEEGTPAAGMAHVDSDTARKRAEHILELQAGIMDQWEASLIGLEIPVLCEYYDMNQACFVGRGYFDSPGIDGRVIFRGSCAPGDIVGVKIISAEDGELTGVQQ
jgi:ribosomal protein S12 methylthiotransferase